MNDGQIYGRGFAFPPRLGENGRVAWSEGGRNVRESIQIILLTEFDERLKLPEFGGGLRSFLFEPNTTSTRRLIEERIVQALGQWEPRIRLESVSVEPDAGDDRVVSVIIQYRLVADGAADQIGLTLRLEGQS